MSTNIAANTSIEFSIWASIVLLPEDTYDKRDLYKRYTKDLSKLDIQYLVLMMNLYHRKHLGYEYNKSTFIKNLKDGNI